VTVNLSLAQEPEADKLLTENPLALVVGMLLDQQIAMNAQPLRALLVPVSPSPKGRKRSLT
jgi:hypothetical protein